MKYKSELIKEIVDTRGHELSSLHYESECVEKWIEETKGAYPKLCDYEGEWLAYYLENIGIGKFPYFALDNISSTTIENTVPIPFKTAILTGNTKYRDIDTGDILNTFDETKNLELVLVKMPVLTTSNEDGTKTNILSTSEEVVLRSLPNGIKDTLNLLTGEYVQRIGEITFNGDETWYPSANASTNHHCIYTRVQGSKNELSYNIVCNSFPARNILSSTLDREGCMFNEWNDGDMANFVIKIAKSKLSSTSTKALKEYLQSNPLTVQYELATPIIKTVDVTIIDESGNNVSKLKAFNGITHIETNGTPANPTFSGEIPVEAITQNLYSFVEED